jgi:hypothetical protein
MHVFHYNAPFQVTQITFKVRVAKFPHTTRFYLCLYTDVYGAELHSIVQVLCHAHHQAALTVLAGQVTRAKLFLPMQSKARRARCYSTAPHEVSFAGAVFNIEAGTVNDMSFSLKTHVAGKRVELLHLVDADTHCLLQSWLLLVEAVLPRVDAKFSVALRVGQPGRKQFQYENPYKLTRTYRIESSRPDKVTLPVTSIEIPALSSRLIPVQILPQRVPHTDAVLVFITDKDGKLEDALQFDLTFKG